MREVNGDLCNLARIYIFQKSHWSCGPVQQRVYFKKMLIGLWSCGSPINREYFQKKSSLACGPVVLLEAASSSRARANSES